MKTTTMKRAALLAAATLMPVCATRAELVACWALNGTGGEATDSSGSGLTGTPAETGLTYAQAGVPAGTYGSIVLDAAAAAALGTSVNLAEGGAFAVANTPVLNGLLKGGRGRFTAMAWVKTTGLPASASYRIVATGLSGTSGWGFGMANVNRVRFTTMGKNDFTSSGTVATNAGWHHVALTVDGAVWTMYADGAAVGTGTIGGYNDTTAANAGIGNSTKAGVDQFKGNLSQLRLYDEVLTAAQIVAEAAKAYVETPLLTPAQLGALTAARTGVLTPRQLGALTPAQTDGLTATVLARLTVAQVAGFTPAQTASFDAARLAALPGGPAVLTPAQLAAVTPGVLAQLAPAQLVGLSSVQVAALRPVQIAALTTAQVGALGAVQVAALTAGQLAVLTGAHIAALDPGAASSLGTAQLGAFTAAQAGAFTAAQTAALSAEQRAALAAGGAGAVATMSVTLYDRLEDGLVGTTTVDLAGVAATAYADGAGLVRRTVDGLGKVATATHDAEGNLLSRRDATGAGTDYRYDGLGRTLVATDAAIAGKTTARTYDAAGRLATTTDAAGVATTYAYDAMDRPVSETVPVNGGANRVLGYGYDDNGNRTTLTDANGAVTTWTYDAANRQIAKTYANGDHRTMAYDALGRLVTLTDENGHDIVATYDLAGRLVARHYAADGSTDTFVYDASSRLVTATKGRYAHTLTYAYDAAGRPAAETQTGGAWSGLTVGSAYDTGGRLAAATLANVPAWGALAAPYAVGYAYDERGMLSTVTAGAYATRYEYRDNGQTAATVHVKLAAPQSDILRTDRTYDAGARLIQVANTAIDGGQVGAAYTLGADDQRLSATEETGRKWDYGYDGLKQLVSAKKTDTDAVTVPPLDQTYAYDPMGNRTAYTEQGAATAYATNAANQYTSAVRTGTYAETRTPVYDRNGNLLADGKCVCVWDADNQLVSVTPATPAAGASAVSFAYDHLGRRTSKTSAAWNTATGSYEAPVTHRYAYQGFRVIYETVGDGPGKTYVWGTDLSGSPDGAGGVGGLLWMNTTTATGGTTTGTAYAYAYDGNGNVRGIVRVDDGTPSASTFAEKYAYDGFGRELASGTPVAGAVNTVRFSTKMLDPETGLNYYGLRYYASDYGRWINRDPILEEGGWNVYAMVGNDSLMMYDVIGLDRKQPFDWHHYLPQAFIDDFKGVGIDINSEEFGLVMFADSHKKLESAGWNTEWKQYLKQAEATEDGITRNGVLCKLAIMKQDKKYAEIIKEGAEDVMSYNKWKSLNVSGRLQKGSNLLGKTMLGVTIVAKGMDVASAAEWLDTDKSSQKMIDLVNILSVDESESASTRAAEVQNWYRKNIPVIGENAGYIAFYKTLTTEQMKKKDAIRLRNIFKPNENDPADAK